MPRTQCDAVTGSWRSLLGRLDAHWEEVQSNSAIVLQSELLVQLERETERGARD